MNLNDIIGLAILLFLALCIWDPKNWLHLREKKNRTPSNKTDLSVHEELTEKPKENTPRLRAVPYTIIHKSTSGWKLERSMVALWGENYLQKAQEIARESFRRYLKKSSRKLH